MAVLSGIRRRLGGTPRPLDAAPWQATSMPSWMAPSDPLGNQVSLAGALARHGEVVWGAVAMANNQLWVPGDHDLPGRVVYSFDPWFDERPELLHQIGTYLFGYYGDEGRVPVSPWERAVADGLRTGFERQLATPLPPQITAGRRVLLTSILIERAHLPRGCIDVPMIPLVALDSGPIRPARVIPSAVWPLALRERWALEGGAAG